MAFAQLARRVSSSPAADAGRRVIAQRSIDLESTIARRREMRAHGAGATTYACQTVAKGTIAAATQRWLRAAAFAHQTTGLAPL